MYQFGLFLPHQLNSLLGSASAPTYLVDLPLQQLILVPATQKLLIPLQVLLKALLLIGGNDFYLWLGNRLGWR